MYIVMHFMHAGQMTSEPPGILKAASHGREKIEGKKFDVYLSQ